ncbi:hypothetical protein E2C01_098044 [Portunus trituberculatus]|uniref:Uncharacterized protein n=1 Tax=Portunus trituberculatus TaxID=210409 RepID=A0A5B7K626_PORTR|nr:hypothetical protein [Portunus trituberculatus]
MVVRCRFNDLWEPGLASETKSTAAWELGLRRR